MYIEKNMDTRKMINEVTAPIDKIHLNSKTALKDLLTNIKKDSLYFAHVGGMFLFVCCSKFIFFNYFFFVSVVIAQEVQAVEGKSVSLPCDVIPPGHDKVYMVFWFQYGSGYPIYR